VNYGGVRAGVQSCVWLSVGCLQTRWSVGAAL